MSFISATSPLEFHNPAAAKNAADGSLNPGQPTFDSYLDGIVRPVISRVMGEYSQPACTFSLFVAEHPTRVGSTDGMSARDYSVAATAKGGLTRKDKEPPAIGLCSEEFHLGEPLYSITTRQGHGYVSHSEGAGEQLVDTYNIRVSFCLDTGAFLVGDGCTETLSHVVITADLKTFALPAEATQLLSSILLPCLQNIIDAWFPRNEESPVDIRYEFNGFLHEHERDPALGEVINVLLSEFDQQLADFLTQRTMEIFF